ncbi:MAG: transposase, partial [Chitinophagaceae bacterium]
MSDTCIEAYFHMVYAVKYRAALIAPSWKDRLHQYSIGIIEGHGHSVLAINTMPDHLHLLFRYNINELIPRLMQHLKRDTSRWINE